MDGDQTLAGGNNTRKIPLLVPAFFARSVVGTPLEWPHLVLACSLHEYIQARAAGAGKVPAHDALAFCKERRVQLGSGPDERTVLRSLAWQFPRILRWHRGSDTVEAVPCSCRRHPGELIAISAAAFESRFCHILSSGKRQARVSVLCTTGQLQTVQHTP